jgi:hypothetical protein
MASEAARLVSALRSSLWPTKWEHLSSLNALRAVCLLAFALNLVVLHVLRVRRQKATTMAAEEAQEEEKRCATPMATEQILRLPQPSPRLRQVGTSFTVPLNRITTCKGGSLSVDIPVAPAVWPLRALFSRSQDAGTCGGDAPWTRFELTVDIIDAAGLPPLLCCERRFPSPGPPRSAADAETGGTVQPRRGTVVGGDTGGLEATGSSACGDIETLQLCLEVRGGGGAVSALLSETAAGKWTVHRPGYGNWTVARREVSEGILFTAYNCGEEVALATRHQCGSGSVEDDCVQVDTLTDTSSPDSLLLFCCILSLLVHTARP